MELDAQIYRHFTRELINSDISVYDLFAWKRVDVRIVDHGSGKVLTDMEDTEFPEHYSQNACDIIASKYFRRAGVPNERGCEYSMRQVAHRMVSFWVEALYDEVLITEDQKQIVYDELVYMLLAQMWAPNSPQWFNTGLKAAYGIDGPAQGHFYFDEETGDVIPSPDAYTRTQGSACFILGVEDSLMGDKSLTDQMTTETLLFKYGSGVGTNWSRIRGKDEPLSGGGRSSGLLSFLKVSDRNAGAIKSGGTTRRAAKMNILNMDHPEIMGFISWKAREEEKAAALAKMGYGASFDSESYDTVSGQNVNNSVRIPDAFMRALEEPGAVWKTRNRLDSSASGEMSVSQIWDGIAQAAWRCGDPGVQFDGTINGWHTCPAGEDGDSNAPHNRINAANPCSEYMFLDDTACNLASINVVPFLDAETGRFDAQGFQHAVRMIQLALEATIHHGQFPTRDIARKSYKFRTTGLGLTNLAALFMLMGLPYDSAAARTAAAALASLMTGSSYHISALMAEKAGPFACWPQNAAQMKRVIQNHAIAAGARQGDFNGLERAPDPIDHGRLKGLKWEEVSEAVIYTWNEAIAGGELFGYRNAQVSVLAPTGTISFAMDCLATSGEPFFSHVIYKKLAGGGSMRIVNPVIPDALRRLDYSEEDVSAITLELTGEGGWGGTSRLKPEHRAVFDTAGDTGDGSVISPEGHVLMVGAITPHISGAISKTVNLPHMASPEDIKGIFRMAWELGVKAITVFRDGCKLSQPLNVSKDSDDPKKLDELTYGELLEYVSHVRENYKPIRVKPKGIRSAHVHEAAIGGLKLYVTTSFYEDGRLGEVYVSSGKQGSLVKGLLDSLSTTISKMLQYGVPAGDIAAMYRSQKYEPSGFVSGHPYIKMVDSISDLISKIIDIELGDFSHCQIKPEPGSADIPAARDVAPAETAKTAPEPARIYGEICPHCKSDKMAVNGTCRVCLDCGTTTGCS